MKKLSRYLLRTLLVLFVLINIITAFHAYKFTHFYDRGTITVKNAAEKTGLDITKEILFGINAIKQSNTVPDTAFERVVLTTAEGIKLEGWHIKTPFVSRGTVLLFHGHGSKKSAVLHEAAAFRSLGYHTFLLDFRAHGNSAGNTTTIGFYETEEVKLAYDYIAGRGENRIIFWGISMGAATITKAMKDFALQPQKIILEMPFGSILQAASGRIKMMGLPGQPLASLITFWGGTEHGFWAFGMKPSVYAQSITVPVLLQWGKNDPRVAREETDAIFANLSGRKQLVVYENAGHESLCDKEHNKWMDNVRNFLNQP